MDDRHLTRIGAVAAIAGAVAQLVATVIEPDWGGDPAKAARIVAGNGFWISDRLLDLVGTLLTVVALTIVGRTLADRPGREWARAGQPLLVLMGALGISAVAVEAALKDLAHSWVGAEGGARQAYLAAFDATARVTENLFFCAFLALGLYLVALAAGILAGGVYARWIGRTAGASALLILAGTLLELVFDAAFLVALAGFVLFLAVQAALGLSMWRREQAIRTSGPAGREPDAALVATDGP